VVGMRRLRGISDWRVRISDFSNLANIALIESNTGSNPMKYKLSNFSLILTGLIGGAVLLVSSGVYAGSGAFEGFQLTLDAYHEDEFDRAKPTAWMGKYGQLTNENVTIDERSVDDSLDRRGSALGTGIGMGVAPLFDTYGVVRTSGKHDKSTYFALGYITDELAMGEAGTSDSSDDSGFSYGFGVNSSSSNFEYMMSVDQENYEVSAIGMVFTSEF